MVRAISAATGYIAIIHGNETIHTNRLKVSVIHKNHYNLYVPLAISIIQQKIAVMDQTAGFQPLMAE
jgi:hypothetical protein